MQWLTNRKQQKSYKVILFNSTLPVSRRDGVFQVQPSFSGSSWSPSYHICLERCLLHQRIISELISGYHVFVKPTSFHTSHFVTLTVHSVLYQQPCVAVMFILNVCAVCSGMESHPPTGPFPHYYISTRRRPVKQLITGGRWSGVQR